ncbi:MAG: 23S rRNA (adenine(2503)-C(2))-methyltransferase RlmN, partial [Actinobacteria bacterium]|nr:23S rRNA (adenine(2503)-C(2))-methyltransferase RlmN [Actinomycetota bacterium]
MPYLHAPEDLGEVVGEEPSYRVDQLHDWLYRTPVLHAEDMTNLPGRLRAQLAETLWPFKVEMEQESDRGTTKKWLFRAPDGAAIETVLMGYRRRATLCISSQAGCALACTFCATGQFGFERHLEAGEIVAQVAYARA